MKAQTEPTAAEKMAAFIAEFRLSMVAEFVPYSVAKASRADWSAPGSPPWVGLTWKVSIYHGEGTPMRGVPGKRLLLETPYSAGIAHCPGYKAGKAAVMAAPWPEKRAREQLCAWECENGKPGRYSTIMGGRDNITSAGGAPILPNFADVLASLAMDSSVLDEGGFEDWAANLGYDTDSRSAEATYRACLEIALKIRAGIGEAGLSALRDAAQDY